VIVYVIGIAVAIIAVALLVVWVGRRRGAYRSSALVTEDLQPAL
jgi:hypothetical protein